MSLTLFD
jgi:hypothetical protein